MVGNMSGISTHILDTSLGLPAAGVQVTLEREAPEDYASPWIHCATRTTDADGRIKPLIPAEQVVAGTHRLHFATAPYFAELETPTLYPEITITFLVAADGASYHIPLLLNPFGYTTYRGT
jgi:5-hydroxyisourate hydrolase